MNIFLSTGSSQDAEAWRGGHQGDAGLERVDRDGQRAIRVQISDQEEDVQDVLGESWLNLSNHGS